MKNLEKVGIAVLILLITAIISIPLINDYYAYGVKTELCKIPLPDRTEIVDSVYKAGKLTGNGIEHGIVRFSEEAGVDGFYIVYSWGEGPKLLEEMDIRGH